MKFARTVEEWTWKGELCTYMQRVLSAQILYRTPMRLTRGACVNIWTTFTSSDVGKVCRETSRLHVACGIERGQGESAFSGWYHVKIFVKATHIVYYCINLWSVGGWRTWRSAGCIAHLRRGLLSNSLIKRWLRTSRHSLQENTSYFEICSLADPNVYWCGALEDVRARFSWSTFCPFCGWSSVENYYWDFLGDFRWGAWSRRAQIFWYCNPYSVCDKKYLDASSETLYRMDCEVCWLWIVMN